MVFLHLRQNERLSMQGIKVIGTSGSRSEKSFSTSIQVTKNTCIDAGNIIYGLGEDAKFIDSIFLSHSHLDHIIDCAFLMDNYFSLRNKPLKIYALPKTLEVLKKNIFNWDIWPDFSKLNLQNTNIPSVEYIEIELESSYEIEEGVKLTPIYAEHVVPCCGYMLEKEDNAIVFSADTYLNPTLWQRVNENEKIKAVIIDVSFPDILEDVAKASKHLTPALLQKELKSLNRKVNVYINHVKPNFYGQVLADLEKVGINKEQVLYDGVELSYDGTLISKV